jgi:signal transduction histidine kinase
MNAVVKTRRLLVADDEEAILAEYRRIFAEAAPASAGTSAASLEAELFGAPAPRAGIGGFELVTCRQGDEAVEAFRRARDAGEPFPVVFLDVRMPPGPNGIDTARAIRDLDPSAHIAIITGYSDLPPEEIAERVQPVDRLFYFEKPFRAVELRQLALALNAKWHAERALEASRDDLEQQVAERTRELALAKDDAESANKSKTAFLTNMSHELRTPLNAVIGFSEFMLAEPHGPLDPKYREYVQAINSSGEHLLDLISTILDLAKAEHGKLTLDERAFPLRTAIGKALKLVQPLAAKGRVTLQNKVSDGVGVVYADETKMVQVLLNLLSNAVKFTPADGRVTVEAEVLPDASITVRISDTGVGIRREDIPKALQPFVQIKGARNQIHPGTGLGLPLSVALIELHGGTLHLESTPGVGTTVSITLPTRRVLPQHAAAQAEAGTTAA